MKKLSLISLLLLLILSQCSELTQILEGLTVQKPTAEVAGISLQNLSPQDADLLFNIKVSNPNSVGIKLSGFDYNLLLQDNSFLKGDEGSEIDIAANSNGVIKFPLTVNFNDLYNTYQNLKNEDEINYTLDLGLNVDLPVLGMVRVPVSKSDKLPTLKIPAVKLKTIKLDNFSLTKASFNLQFEVNNPKQWNLKLDKMDYNLVVNNKKWAVGNITEQIKVKSRDKNLVKIPFTINYLDVGSSVFNMIKNDAVFDYKFTGNADVGSSVKFLESFSFPFEKSGSVNLAR